MVSMRSGKPIRAPPTPRVSQFRFHFHFRSKPALLTVTTLAIQGDNYGEDERWEELDPRLGYCFWLAMVAGLTSFLLGGLVWRYDELKKSAARTTVAPLSSSPTPTTTPPTTPTTAAAAAAAAASPRPRPAPTLSSVVHPPHRPSPPARNTVTPTAPSPGTVTKARMGSISSISSIGSESRVPAVSRRSVRYGFDHSAEEEEEAEEGEGEENRRRRPEHHQRRLGWGGAGFGGGGGGGGAEFPVLRLPEYELAPAPWDYPPPPPPPSSLPSEAPPSYEEAMAGTVYTMSTMTSPPPPPPLDVVPSGSAVTRLNIDRRDEADA